jgi:ribosomal protein S12 methylthiotransferase
LKLMKRPAAAENTLERIAAWRRVAPDITIRSTFIVGFPGETDRDFEELLAWLREAQLDRVGCFEYSPVEGAAANALKEIPVPAELKAERRARFMELAAEISAARLRQKIGRTLPVLIDGIDAKNDIAIARSASDAPEIDGTVRIAGARRAGRLLAVGSLVDVQITAAGDYDLEARLIDPIN